MDNLIEQIANGGSFDMVDAIRAIARKLAAMEAGKAVKAAPPATTEATELASAATRKGKPTTES